MAGRSRWSGWLLLLSVLCVCGPAAADEPGDASLELRGGRAGETDVELFIYRRLADRDRLRAVMRRTFGVEFDTNGADDEEDPSSFVVLTAEDVPLFPREGLTRSLQVDLGPLLGALREEGFPSLEVGVSHYRAGFGRSSLGPVVATEEYGRDRCSAQLPTDGSAPPVTVAYGYTAANVLGILLALGAVVTAPVLLILRLRRAALQAEVADPAAVWFAYVRFSNGVSLGMWLAWGYVSILLNAGSLLSFLVPIASGMASSAMHLGAFYLPPTVAMLLCSVLSHPVHARVRGSQWTTGDLARQTFWSLAVWALPLLMLLAGVGALGDGRSRAAAALFVGAFLVSFLARVRLMKAMDLTPHALETGEMRDRVFALAAKAGVKLRQIYVLPAGKGNLANAFASHAGHVLVSDYLLRTLSKREVDAVMAHEVAHLRRRHPAAMRLAFVLAIAVPIALAVVLPMNPESVSGRLTAHVPLVLAAGLFLAYQLSRRLERSADAGAAALTGDPEAMITSLAKLMRLNLMPLEWGRWFERTITHPSTQRRAMAVARKWGIPPERVSELLASPESGGEHYTIPTTTLSEETVFTTAFKHRIVSRIAWSLIAALTVTPALLYAAVHSFRPEAAGGIPPFLGVTAATFLLYLLSALFLPLWGYGDLQQRLRRKMEGEGIPVDAWEGTFVGYAPGLHPRVYEGYYNWDIGFLFLAGDRLCYVGDQARLAIPAAHVAGVWLGQGSPSWWRSRRLTVAWRDPEASTEGVFSVGVSDARSLRDQDRRTAALAERVQAWRQAPPVGEVPPALAALAPPGSDEVTSISPRAVAGCATVMNSMLQMLFLSVCVSALFGLHFFSRAENLGWGALFATLVCTMLQWLPLLRYRDRQPKGALPSAIGTP